MNTLIFGPNCIKKSIFDNIKFPYKKTLEDLSIFLPTLMKANIICVIPQALYYYRNNRINSLINLSNKQTINIEAIETYIIFFFRLCILFS